MLKILNQDKSYYLKVNQGFFFFFYCLAFDITGKGAGSSIEAVRGSSRGELCCLDFQSVALCHGSYFIWVSLCFQFTVFKE